MQSRKEQPSTARPIGAGFTLIEMMIVVTLVGLLVALAIPNMVKARETSQLNLIYRNLRVLEGAKDQWALENHKGNGDTITDVNLLSGYLQGGKINDAVHEHYIPNPVGTPPDAALPAGVKLGPYPAGAVIPAP